MSCFHVPIASTRFAFLSPDDPLCDGLSIPQSASKVRLAGYDEIPLFTLFYEKQLLDLDPYEVLSLIAQDRVFFPSSKDKEDFILLLESHLETYDEVNRRIKKFKKAAMVFGGVVALLSAAALALRHRPR